MGVVARRRGIEVVQAAAECLPMAEATFDVALMVTTLCFLEDARLSLREIHRILKQGGALVVGFIDRDSPLGREYEAKKADSVFYRHARFFRVTEVRDLMESSGFQELAWVQTLFHDVARLRTADPVRPGYGQGSFVAVRGTKTLPPLHDRPVEGKQLEDRFARAVPKQEWSRSCTESGNGKEVGSGRRNLQSGTSLGDES